MQIVRNGFSMLEETLVNSSVDIKGELMAFPSSCKVLSECLANGTQFKDRLCSSCEYKPTS